MRCHDVATALLDAHPPWPLALRAHLEGCEDCRLLATLHASAASLRPPEPPPIPPVAREEVLREVRRRGRRRRAALGVAVCFFVGGLVLASRPSAPPAAHSWEAQVDGEAIAQAVLAERGSLASLVTEVRGYTRREVVVHDETYRPFGMLAAWLRPPDSRALETPPFQTALIPIGSQELIP
ncbi:hypothetical protein [Stigmatella aurantiaca]|uniref:Zinc-finger domain-containing protein n=1 Tax=Stigmatella aurantiaca (strain DW4/3-1) TaxID=378806 RepID=Q096T1_STIAD|nr:hypothetical protein [Stigmatella aurantiaca]ADO68544.1 uncharacterized protein STAUR_0740 [Stigmatella aurantiaca DW4/3-1]EAU67705.1 hypothetical protein STIAU_0443 [Stigmatella aurantiaca DW4/3-1]